MIVTPDSNGKSSILCDGSHFMLIHDDVKVKFKGHCGQANTPDTLEHFDTEFDMEDRIISLDLDTSEIDEA